jgi:hypothetical protein
MAVMAPVKTKKACPERLPDHQEHRPHRQQHHVDDRPEQEEDPVAGRRPTREHTEGQRPGGDGERRHSGGVGTNVRPRGLRAASSTRSMVKPVAARPAMTARTVFMPV